MKLSPSGEHLIASFEGWSPGWYNDGTGVQTIGYGHTGPLPAGFTAPLTVDLGLELLRRDSETAATAVSEGVRVRLGILPGRAQARFDALVSLVFNIGAGAFAGSSLLREINRRGAPRSWVACGPLWCEWDEAGGGVLPGLLRRRRIEFAIFASGKY